MRTNLLKILSTALLAATAIWQTSAAPAGVIRKYYTEVYQYGVGGAGSGNAVDLIGWGNFPWFPTETTYPPMLEDTTPDDSNAGHENFGIQLTGVLNPPVTGNYQFFLSADDNAMLFLSTDEDPANKRLIASEPVWNGHRQWTITDRRNATAPENRSATLYPAGINLVAGQRYYIEAIEKEGGGGNNVGVTWQIPGGPVVVNGTTLPIEVVKGDGTWTNIYAPSLFLASAAQDPSGNKVALTFSTTLDSAGANNPANYTISGGLSITAASLMPDKRSVVLSLNDALNTLQTYTVTAANLVDATPDANPIRFRTSASFRVLPVNDGGLRADAFGGIGGTALSALTNDVKYLNNIPDLTQIITSFDVNQTSPDQSNFGVHITGYLVPPESGNYTFVLNSDDASQFQIGGSADPKGKVSVTRDDGCCADRTSPIIPLIGGEAYFVEAWYKEGGGGDHLNIRWKNNGTIIGSTLASIPGTYLKWYSTPVSIVRSPLSTTNNEGTDVTFSVVAGGDAPFTYQWLTNGVPVPGGNGPTLTLAYILNRDNNKQVSVIVSNYVTGTPPGVGPFSATSAAATLTVVGDTAPPAVVSAFNGPGANEVRVVFSEPVLDGTGDPSNPIAINANNFIVSDSADPTLNPFIITSAAAVAGSPSVVLITLQDPLTPGSTYYVQAQLVYDASPSHNEISPDPTVVSFAGIVPNPDPGSGSVLLERYEGVNNPSWLISVLKNSPHYPYLPDNVSLRQNFNVPQTAPNLETFGYRARSYLVPPETANYVFQVGADDSAFLYLSTGVDPANKVKVAGIDGAGCAACSYANPSAAIRLNAGQVYYMEALMVEQGGGDWLNVQWKNNASIPGFVDIPSTALTLFVDPSRSGLTVAPLADVTTNGCSPVTLTAIPSGGDGSFDLHYTWTIDGNPPIGLVNTNASFTTPPLEVGSYIIAVDVTMFGGVKVTRSATVTVTGDPTIPKILQARISKSLNKVTFNWNTVVGPSALVPENYLLQDSLGNVATLSNGAQDVTGTIITFDSSPLTLGETYNVQEAGIFNACGDAGNDQTPLVFRAPYYVPGIVKVETYGDPGSAGGIAGNNVGNLLADPRYPNSPRDGAYIPAVDSRLFYPDDSHEAYGGRMSGYFTPATTDNYIFYTKGDDGQRFNMNTNELDSANPAGITTLIDTGDACCQNWSDRPSASIHLNGGQKYYFESLWKEGGGGDFCQVVYKESSRSDDPNGLPIMAGAGISAIADDVDLASGSFLPQVLPSVGVLAPGSLSNRGFQVHMVQVTSAINNDTPTAEALLACSAGPNVIGQPRFNAALLNYNIVGNNDGRVKPDVNFPGTPGRTGSTDNMALEALTYLDLQPGVYSFSVNSDDGFRVSPATSVTDPRNSITLGEFSGGRGSSDTIFRFRVLTAGLYPFRLIWEQGGGGANLEFYSQGSGAVFGLINLDSGIHAFLPTTTPIDTVPPLVQCPTNRNLVITNGCSAVVPDLLAEFLAADCQSVVTTTQTPAPGTVVTGPSGTVTLTFKATDDSGNFATCTTVLTIVDGAAPVITSCAPATTVPADASCQGVMPDLTAGVTATDGCGGAVTITQSPAAGSAIPAGPNAVTLTATDAAGNFSTCVTTVSVVPPGPTPSLVIGVSGGSFSISWSSPSPCWKVQGAASLPTTGPATWTTIPGTSPVTVPNDSQMKFFRLIAAP